MALALLSAAFLFLLLHGYNGLIHDGRLYTLQALAALRPELFASDVFIALGSQDDFTIFSPLYAATIRWLGIERAAALLTVTANLLFLGGCLALARSLLTKWQAWVALLLVLLVPAQYGPAEIFHYMEGFVTPRQFAAAIVMFGLWFWSQDRPIAGLLIASGSMLIHPIIGLSGVLLIAGLHWALQSPRTIVALIVLAALAMALALSGLLPLARWQFDATWYDLASSRVYLDMRNWSGADWGRIATVYATLFLGAVTLQPRVSRLAAGTLILCTAMLVLGFVGGNLLRIAIVAQAQTWRALWLATVLAVLLLAPLFVAGWNQQTKRSALLLLAAAWMAPHESFSLALSSIAAVVACYAGNVHLNRHSRILQAGAWLIVFCATAFALADATLVLRSDLARGPQFPQWLDRLVTLSLPGTVPALILLLGSYLAVRLKSPGVLGVLLFITSACAVLSFPPLVRAWTRDEYSVSHAAFATWRSRIPEGSDVFWSRDDTLDESGAFYAWMLLERPSFVSRTQASNALFSRRSALEMQKRAQSLQGLLPLEDPFGSETSEVRRPLHLAPICRQSRVRYIVSSEDFEDAVGISAPASVKESLRDYKLYICP